MRLRTTLVVATNAAVVLLASLVGLSLTRTKVASSAQAIEFALAGAAFALVAIGIARAVSGRVVEALPPLTPKQLLGLKAGLVGFVVAVCGWLVAVFIQLNAGVAIGVIGIALGFVGMAVHFYVMVTRNGG